MQNTTANHTKPFNKQDACYTGITLMLGLIHLFQLYASPIDKTILANGIV